MNQKGKLIIVMLLMLVAFAVTIYFLFYHLRALPATEIIRTAPTEKTSEDSNCSPDEEFPPAVESHNEAAPVKLNGIEQILNTIGDKIEGENQWMDDSLLVKIIAGNANPAERQEAAQSIYNKLGGIIGSTFTDYIFNKKSLIENHESAFKYSKITEKSSTSRLNSDFFQASPSFDINLRDKDGQIMLTGVVKLSISLFDAVTLNASYNICEFPGSLGSGSGNGSIKYDLNIDYRLNDQYHISGSWNGRDEFKIFAGVSF